MNIPFMRMRIIPKIFLSVPRSRSPARVMSCPFRCPRPLSRLNHLRLPAVGRSVRGQKGGIAPFAVLVLIGATVATAYAIDVTRTTSNASQLKRATDAAALAVAREYVLQEDDFPSRRDALAANYVRDNLGLDTQLRDAVSDISVRETTSGDGSTLLSVEASVTSQPILDSFGQPTITVHSTAEVRAASTEVAVLLPNDLSANAGNLAATRRLARAFTRDVVEANETSWVSLVPYSQAVNVYDPDDPKRIRRWTAPGALRPVELTSLFNSGYGDLADRRIPDRRANLLCLYRGLGQGELYHWTEPPAGQFEVYYRADLPANGSPGAAPISWIGPNPMFGQATGDNDVRYMVADRGCPNAALLPLTNDLDKIYRRLDEMSTRFNMNLSIPLGWAGMSLAPAFRGSDGWGMKDLPKDFDPTGEENRVKAIVVLVNTEGRWFDTDAYNDGMGKVGSSPESGDATTRARQRLVNLCQSFRQYGIRVYVIAAEADDDPVADTTAFREIATDGLTLCTDGGKHLHFLPEQNILQAEAKISDLLTDIANDLRQQGGFIRLAE